MIDRTRPAAVDPVATDPEASLGQRKDFARFSDEEAGLLVELRGLFEREAPAVVDAFYAHLERQGELRSLLGDPELIERLKRVQHRYLLSLTSGEYGLDYAESRSRIGTVHEAIGLLPQWYVGTYGLYLDELLPRIDRHYASDPDRAKRSVSALVKLLVLDMQLVLDAYYEARQRKAMERAEQLAAVGELAASIAHEVRNPLAGMKGAIEVLRKGLPPRPATEEIVDELVAQIDRLENLVRDLLTYARPRPLSLQRLDLHEQLDRLLRGYKDEADAAGITVHRIYGPGSGCLLADGQQLEQVFLNLIQNAVQAMESGGTLTLTTRVDDGHVVIALQDSGGGVTEGALRNIFQPFFTTRHRGSGLGLPIVRKIVEAHDGTIVVESQPGKGCTAIVTLPRGEAP